MAESKAGWTCPVCGRQFRQRTLEHTCAVFALERHTAGKPAAVAALCGAWLAAVWALGEVSIEPLRTSIVLRTQTNFGGIVVQQRGLRCSLMLGSVPDSPRILGHAPYSAGRISCSFRLDKINDIDAEALGWLNEAYELAS